MAGTRADTWALHLTVAGVDWDIWDKKTGGQLDSEEYKYSPGAMATQVSLGGRRTTENLTVQRLYRKERDHDRVQALFDGVGKAKCVLKQQPMDPDGNRYGNPVVWNGTLKRVQVPDVDSERSEAALIELEITVDGYPVLA